MADIVSLGKCPFCEGQIVEKEKNFQCTNAKWEKENEKWENKGCKYSIYKQGLAKMGKPEITASEIKDLLENGSVEIELVSKKTMKVSEQYGVQVDFTKK